MNKYYTGVGSREVPLETLDKMVEIGEYLAKQKFTLRSGAAAGSDSAFEQGCDKAKGLKEIYLPWLGFNDHPSQLLWEKRHWDIAAEIHPVWDELNVNAKCLHARNSCQLLGMDAKTPSLFVIAYTEGGKIQGGTATVLNLAKKYDVPVFNLGFKNGLDKFRKFCKNGYKL